MKKTILTIATFISVVSAGALSGCAYPDHSGPYMDQHNGREEQSNADNRRDRRDNGNYRDDRDHRDDNQTDPRRQ